MDPNMYTVQPGYTMPLYYVNSDVYSCIALLQNIILGDVWEDENGDALWEIAHDLDGKKKPLVAKVCYYGQCL